MEPEVRELTEYVRRRCEEAKTAKSCAEEHGEKSEAVAWAHTFLAYDDVGKQIDRLMEYYK